MRRIVLAGAAVVVAIVAFYAVTPWLAVRGLRDALERRDVPALQERIDFDRVRQGFKDQIQDRLHDDTPPDAAKDPLAAIAIGVVSKAMEVMVDALVTPSSLATMAQGIRPPTVPGGAAPPEGSPTPKALFSDARIAREGVDRFSLFVPSRAGGDLRFVFRRHGLSWKLDAILLPAGMEAGEPGS